MIPKRIILHHSLTKDSQTVSWGAIRKYHMEVMGWKEIGYHFGSEIVGDHYEILVGRMMNEVGAHCEGQNKDTLSICFVGNFDLDEVPPEQWNQGIKLVASLCTIFKISPSMIYGHHEFNPNKTCPGLKFPVHGFIQQVAERIGSQ